MRKPKKFAFIPKPMKTVVVLLTVGVLAGACETPPPIQTFAEITFAHLEPLNINVAKVEVENAYRTGGESGHVENRFPVPPVKAMEQWVVDRLKPIGGPASGKLRLVITDAGVLETVLKKDKSAKGVFTKQQSHRYDLTAGGRLEIYDAAGARAGYSVAKATRTVTTREDINLNEREKIWFGATEKLMADFNREMETNIRRYVGAWVK